MKHNRSIQVFNSQNHSNTKNFLHQSNNFPVVRSLNLQSSNQNEKAMNLGLKFKNGFNPDNVDSGRANTVRVGNDNLLKRSFQSLNQVKINLNQARVEARQGGFHHKNSDFHNSELRKIQTERKMEGPSESQHFVAELEPSKEVVGPTNPLKIQKMHMLFPQQRYLIQGQSSQDSKMSQNARDDLRRSSSQKNMQIELRSKDNSGSGPKSSNNNVVLMTVRPSAFMQDSEEQMSTESMKQRKVEMKEKQKKFTSYKVVLSQDPSSGSVPSMSQRSLPSLYACQSTNVRFVGDRQSSSGGKAVSGSESKEKYHGKYKKANQIQLAMKMEESVIGKSQVFQEEEQGKIIIWKQGDIIGLGSSSVVYNAIRVDTKEQIAVKMFKVVSDITGVDQQKLKIIKNEIQNFKQLIHPNIVKFHGCELLGQFFCLYLEKLDTSLANIISNKGSFEEAKVRIITKQIVEGLLFLHDKKIKHLDLKCSNILLNNNTKELNIKLCDFGSAREFKKGSNSISTSFTSLKSQIVGSIQWMAPEVIAEQGSGSKSDIWSLGCTIVEMFVGGNPWGDLLDDQNLFQAQQVLLNQQVLPDIPNEAMLSEECRDFIRECLTRDYSKRPSAAQLLQHKWLQDVTLSQ